MALRLTEIIVPQERASELSDLLEKYSKIDLWTDTIGNRQVLIRILIEAEQSEEILDVISRRFGAVDGFRLMLLDVEATLPRIEENETKPETNLQEDRPVEKKRIPQRLSRKSCTKTSARVFAFRARTLSHSFYRRSSPRSASCAATSP